MPRASVPARLLQSSVALVLCMAAQARSQQSQPQDPASQAASFQTIAQQAREFLLHHEIIDPQVLVPETGKPLPTSGDWSADPQRPAICPASEVPCLRVFYKLPNTTVSCDWVVLLTPADTPAILEQNADATRYALRRVLPGEAAPLIVSRVQPTYPPIAAAHLEGSVEVLLLVGPSGEPSSATAISGPPALRGVARQAARQWRFKPLTVGDAALPFQLAIKFTFTLNTAGPSTVTSEP